MVQTLREQLLSGNNRVRLAQIVAMRQHMSAVGELDEVYDADVRWYEVPRDRSLGLDCTKVQLLQPQLWGGAFIFFVYLSCLIVLP